MRSRNITAAKADLNAPAYFLFVPLVARYSGKMHPELNMHLVSPIR